MTEIKIIIIVMNCNPNRNWYKVIHKLYFASTTKIQDWYSVFCGLFDIYLVRYNQAKCRNKFTFSMDSEAIFQILVRPEVS